MVMWRGLFCLEASLAGMNQICSRVEISHYGLLRLGRLWRVSSLPSSAVWERRS